MCETLAILRAIGKDTGFYPSDAQDQYSCDVVVEQFASVFSKILPIVFSGSDES